MRKALAFIMLALAGVALWVMNPQSKADPMAQLVARDCMARNIYHEARGEPLAGQLAVAYVVKARMADKRWRGDVCKVVFQKAQFSWTLQKHLRTADTRSWQQAEAVAEAALGQSWGMMRVYYILQQLRIEGANHYHRDDIAPKWRKRMTPLATIGRHIFYRG
ncbi:MAG: cell wall hydrolase [Alphaproteobacteria bacterium]